MKFSIIPVEQQISLHPVSEFFEELVQENAIKQNILLDVGGLACLDEQNQIIYLYKRPDLQFMLFIEATYAQALQVFIENFLNRNTITVKTAVLFLTIAEKFNLTEVDVYPLYPLLKWPVSKKGFEFFRIFKTFSHDLQQLVLNKQLSLNDGVFFHQTFQN